MALEMNLFNINHHLSQVGKGKCLISEPFSPDSYFGRSLVLITEHSETEGTIGFILNKPIDVPFNDLFPELPAFSAPCFMGGPVNPETIHYIHTRSDLFPDSTMIMKNIFWGGDFEFLKRHIADGFIKPNEIRFFLGYSGWSPNQLRQEIDDKFWIVSNIKPSQIMNAHQNSWKELLSELGDSYTLWANSPLNPGMN